MVLEDFVVPNTWFGVFDDMAPIVQVSLDGSYSRSDHPTRVFAYAGLFGYEAAWKALFNEWMKALPPGVQHFRTNSLRDTPGFAELRAKLGGICADVGLNAVGAAARQELLHPSIEVKRKRDVFLIVVNQLLRTAPPGVNFALVCDREQDLAKEILKWVDQERAMSDRLAGICFMNSRLMLQTQAADLVVGLLREFAERKEADKSAELDPVLRRLMPNGIDISWAVKLDDPGA